jgi:hypothetical protein
MSLRVNVPYKIQCRKRHLETRLPRGVRSWTSGSWVIEEQKDLSTYIVNIDVLVFLVEALV